MPLCSAKCAPGIGFDSGLPQVSSSLLDSSKSVSQGLAAAIWHRAVESDVRWRFGQANH